MINRQTERSGARCSGTRKTLIGLFLVGVFCLLVFQPQRAAMLDEEPVSELQSRYLTNDRLNRLRSSQGIRALTISPELGSAAQAHARYMASVRELTGQEKPKEAGFTGILARDRALYAGYRGVSVLEAAERGVSSYQGLLEEALHDPAYRYALLHPDYDEVGYGIQGDYAGILLGRSGTAERGTVMVSYPYAGQQEVRNCYLSRLQSVPEEVRNRVNRAQIGEPITFTCYLPHAQAVELRKVSLTLTDMRREVPVPLFIVLPQENYDLPQMLTAYPLEQYLSDTQYEASLSCEVWSEGVLVAEVNETWLFTSSGPDSLGEVSRLESLLAMSEIFKVSEEPLDTWPQKYYTDYRYYRTQSEVCTIYRLAEEGVLAPDTEGELRPAEGVTRAQTVIWMMRMLRQYKSQLYYSVTLDYSDTFEDINRAGEEGAQAIQRAYQLRLVQGQGGGMFSPDVYITQAEFRAWTAALQSLIARSEEQPVPSGPGDEPTEVDLQE